MPNPCCCSCTFVNQNFASLPNGSNIGGNWTKLSGGWEISSGTLTTISSNAQIYSVAGSPSQQFNVGVYFSTFPVGSTARIYAADKGASSYYVEMSTTETGYTTKVVGSSTATVTTNWTGSPSTSIAIGIQICKDDAGKWIISSNVDNAAAAGSWSYLYTGPMSLGEYVPGPPGSTFIVDVVTPVSAVQIAAIAGVALGTTKCPGGCTYDCGIYCANATMIFTVSGISDGVCCPGGGCGEFNGTWTLQGCSNGYSNNTTCIGEPNDCSCCEEGTPQYPECCSHGDCGDQYFCGNPTTNRAWGGVSYSIAYNSTTDQTTITVGALPPVVYCCVNSHQPNYQGTKVISGKLDCITGWGPYEITSFTDLNGLAPSGYPAANCDLSGMSASLQCIGGG